MDPIIQKANKWYYFNETFTDLIGPFSDENTARLDLAQYALELDGKREPIGDEEEFWREQFELNKQGEILSPKATQEQIEIAWHGKDQTSPAERIEINSIEDLSNLYGLIDGGYITFVYGSRRGGNFGGWDLKKHQFKNHLILMDSGGVRQSEYEPYKSRRKDRRNQYEYMRLTYEQVKWFRKVIKQDPTIYTAEYEGYEADDMIALLYLKGIGCRQIIAQDKDFLQIEGLGNSMTDHNGIPQHRTLKLPKYALEPNSPASFSLTQALFGDTSDSIPRLLPSRSGYKQLYTKLLKRAPSILAAYWNCMAEFGEQFLINLRLVLLPHPTLSNQDYSVPGLLFEDLCTRQYWNPSHYDDAILQTLIDSLKDLEW